LVLPTFCRHFLSKSDLIQGTLNFSYNLIT